MKRIFALVLALLICIGLVACNKQTDSNPGENLVNPSGVETTGDTNPSGTGTDDPVNTDPSGTGTDDPDNTDPSGTVKPCSHSYGAWTVTKTASCTATGERKCVCTMCGDEKVESIEKTAHTVVVDKGYSATCTKTGLTDGKHCSVCHTVLVKQTSVPKASHVEVLIAGKPASATESGLSAGSTCSVCAQILVEQKVIEPYLVSCKSDYAYRDLKKQAKGDEKQTLYSRIDAQAAQFHSGDANAEFFQNDLYLAYSVDFSDLGLSTDDAVYVWNSYKSDHPLYYWMSNTLSFTENNIHILTDAAYAQGSARADCNRLVYQELTEWYNIAANETSPYQIALAYHDAIIQAIDYAYQSDGMTPESAVWAHNILGVFEKGKGVCESYAKTFQVFLNIHGVENVLVTGVAGTDPDRREDHAWNLAKMDDGMWYWFDLTWDDVKWEHQMHKWGVNHNYFCVNDTQNVTWVDDGPNQPDEKTFMDQHTPGITLNNAFENTMSLPDRSKSVFSASDSLLRATFSVDNFTYSIAGYNEVQLTAANQTGVVVIPEFVTKNGRQYTVISIGELDRQNGYYTPEGSAVIQMADKVVIPKTVKFIWDRAMGGMIGEFEVAEGNPCYASKDGVLFTKSLYTLIQYPAAAEYRDKYVIPEATANIAYRAFANLQNGFGELAFSAKLSGIGQAGWGYGYHDKAPTGPFGGNYVSGDITQLLESAVWRGKTIKITVPDANETFKVINSVLYHMYEGAPSLAIAGVDPTVETIEVMDGTETIEQSAFAGCTALKKLILPGSLDTMWGTIFGNNEKATVTYNGTQAQWQQLVGDDSTWDCYNDSVEIPVTCTK